MPVIKTSPDHPASMEARIHKRLQNSGGDRADVIVKNGDGARRTYHNLHFGAGHVKPLDTRDRTIRETMHQKPPGASK